MRRIELRGLAKLSLTGIGAWFTNQERAKEAANVFKDLSGRR